MTTATMIDIAYWALWTALGAGFLWLLVTEGRSWWAEIRRLIRRRTK